MENTPSIDPWLVENLRCPKTGSRLELKGNFLTSESGVSYPVAHGIPVMLIEDREQTIGLASESLRLARLIAEGKETDTYCVKSIGIDPNQQQQLLSDLAKPDQAVDPVVSALVSATNGIAYEHLRISGLQEVPIPSIRLPKGSGRLLDIGCSWGRWCMSAARLGYQPVGIDPSLGAVLAARRLAKSMGLEANFVVGDARWLPFAQAIFPTVFSYSVIQHFSKPDARLALKEIGRVLTVGGHSLVQMPNRLGIRCLQHQLRRGFREPESFDVRYYGYLELLKLFCETIGPTNTSVDCFFGIGLQASDLNFMTGAVKQAIRVSEVLRKASAVVAPLKWVADSVYLDSARVA